MIPDERYPIEVYMMTENRCYKAGRKIAPIGIQVHSVGCKGTDRDRWRRWNTPTIDKCATAIIDTNGIMQCLPWDCRPWLSGKGNTGNANDYMVGFEMCEPSTANDTPEAAEYLFNCAKYLCVQLCVDYGILPGNVLCHSELHRLGVASNHADVNHWWGKKGTSWEPYTMTRFRAEIADELTARGLPTQADQLSANRLPTLRRGFVGEETRYLQRLLSIPVDGQYGPASENAVRSFQKSHRLVTDGICGPKTWAALLDEDDPEPVPVPEDPDDDPDEDVPSDREERIEAAIGYLKMALELLQ